MLRKKKEMTTEEMMKAVEYLLENPLPMPEVEHSEAYSRLHDDHDGTCRGKLIVQMDQNGDMWFNSDARPYQCLRFRNFIGGGRSLRVHNALRILALAIKKDSEQFPDPTPGPADDEDE